MSKFIITHIRFVETIGGGRSRFYVSGLERDPLPSNFVSELKDYRLPDGRVVKTPTVDTSRKEGKGPRDIYFETDKKAATAETGNGLGSDVIKAGLELCIAYYKPSERASHLRETAWRSDGSARECTIFEPAYLTPTNG